MTKTTAPRVRAVNLYTIESDGQPVAQAMAISQAEAVRLYVESMQQPTMSARLSSPLEARTLAGLPLLQREPIAVDTRTADLFGDALLSDEPMAADISTDAAEHLQACGVNIVAADHVEDMLAMVQDPAAVQPGEPAEPAALDASAPAGVDQACSESGMDDVPADSELRSQAVAAAQRRAHGGKPVAMYRNPVDGASWSWRGLKPRWLVEAIEAGRTQDEFLIGA